MVVIIGSASGKYLVWNHWWLSSSHCEPGVRANDRKIARWRERGDAQAMRLCRGGDAQARRRKRRLLVRGLGPIAVAKTAKTTAAMLQERAPISKSYDRQRKRSAIECRNTVIHYGHVRKMSSKFGSEEASNEGVSAVRSKQTARNRGL